MVSVLCNWSLPVVPAQARAASPVTTFLGANACEGPTFEQIFRLHRHRAKTAAPSAALGAALVFFVWL